MNKYRDKSDFEINLRVAQIIFTDSEYDVIKQSMEVVKFQNGNGKGTCHVFDPCNNPYDAMPIIIENGICMNYIDKDIGWCAYHFDEEKGELEIYGKNYYRAAMICFLMIKEAENES
ncbi:phage protein NinX family protein [Morganella morganii]|uniref:phage protein NinX family protein n=1 Tax=Morganella morganii TaxID=582 RepID=UPI003EB918FB